MNLCRIGFLFCGIEVSLNLAGQAAEGQHLFVQDFHREIDCRKVLFAMRLSRLVAFRIRLRLACVGLLLFALTCVGARQGYCDDLASLAMGKLSNAEAASLAQALQEDQDTQLLDVLSAMKGGTAVGNNWLLSVAQAVADRDVAESKKTLEQFLPKLSEDSSARYWAFHYLTRDLPERKEELLESMLADPCLELRYEAVALGLERLESSEADKAAKLAGYQECLAAARLPEQVQEIAKNLSELGVEVDLLEHFGFLSAWQVVGPFNNADGVGFAQVYQPELDYSNNELEMEGEYQAKNGVVKWTALTTEAEDGAIDLAAALSKEKGAVAYALGKFLSTGEIACELRIGSPNASKVWLNGELVIDREVYHSGSQIDQYVAPVKLKSGANSILVKSCQNEQTESWAQDWAFQLRFTDSSGFAIQPQG